MHTRAARRQRITRSWLAWRLTHVADVVDAARRVISVAVLDFDVLPTLIETRYTIVQFSQPVHVNERYDRRNGTMVQTSSTDVPW